MNNKTLLTLAFFISFSAMAQTAPPATSAEKDHSFFSRIIPDFLKKKADRRSKKTIEKPKPSNSLSVSMMPKFYKKRNEAVLDIGLVYYGDYYTMDDLSRVQVLLEERFFKATGEILKLNTVAKAVKPFKSQIENFPDYSQQYVTEIDRLQRLWYYDNVGAGVLKEVYEIFKKDQNEIDLDKIDVLVIVTGAQFDALGFASGRVAITENPMEIAWALDDGGRVEFVSDERVVDELIHEVGHTMFLNHTSNQCQNPKLTFKEQAECCENSESKDDVMSYCRKRSKVDETFFYGFKDCSRRIIKDRIIPALLSGGAWAIPDRETCM